MEKVVPLPPVSKSGCSAVGSALRSGRRGRVFESRHPDKKSPSQHCRDGLSYLSVERDVLHSHFFVEEKAGTLAELSGRFGGEVLAGTALGESLVHLWMPV